MRRRSTSNPWRLASATTIPRGKVGSGSRREIRSHFGTRTRTACQPTARSSTSSSPSMIAGSITNRAPPRAHTASISTRLREPKLPPRQLAVQPRQQRLERRSALHHDAGGGQGELWRGRELERLGNDREPIEPQPVAVDVAQLQPRRSRPRCGPGAAIRGRLRGADRRASTPSRRPRKRRRSSAAASAAIVPAVPGRFASALVRPAVHQLAAASQLSPTHASPRSAASVLSGKRTQESSGSTLRQAQSDALNRRALMLAVGWWTVGSRRRRPRRVRLLAGSRG